MSACGGRTEAPTEPFDGGGAFGRLALCRSAIDITHRHSGPQHGTGPAQRQQSVLTTFGGDGLGELAGPVSGPDGGGGGGEQQPRFHPMPYRRTLFGEGERGLGMR